jgi:hypothetical protein
LIKDYQRESTKIIVIVLKNVLFSDHPFDSFYLPIFRIPPIIHYEKGNIPAFNPAPSIKSKQRSGQYIKCIIFI